MVEPEGWTCCGATAGHQTDRILAAALPAATLVKVKDMGLDLVVNCAACYNRMKVANHEIAANKQVRAKVAEAVGRDYDGSVKVRHLLEVLLDDVGADAIRKALHSSLGGLKVASYYGCLLVRPRRSRGSTIRRIRARWIDWLPRWAARPSNGRTRWNAAAAACRCPGPTWS